MYKLVSLLVFLVFVGPSAIHVAAQSKNSKTTALPNIKSPNTAINSAPAAMSSSPERNAEAKRFYDEGLKLTEAEQYPKAAEAFQQAVRLDADFADAYAALGRAYFKMREWQNASDNLRHAAQLRIAQNAQNEKQAALRDNLTNTVSTSSLQTKPPQKPATTAPSITRQPSVPTLGTNAPNNAAPQRSSGAAQTNTIPNLVDSSTPAPRTQSGAPAADKNIPVSLPPKVTSEKTAPVEVKTVASDAERRRSSVDQNNSITKAAGNTPPSTRPSSVQTIESISAKNPGPSSLSAEQKTTPSTRSSVPVIETNVAKTPEPVRTATKQTNTIPNLVDSSTTAPRTQSSAPTVDKNIPVSLPPKVAPAKTAPVEVKSEPLESLKTQDRKDGTDGQALDVRQEAVAERVSLEASTVTVKAPSEEIALTKVYRVGPSDVLDVRLNDSSTPKSTLFTVTATGFLEHPLLAEPLPVAGLTVEEIASKIEEDLTKRALIESPKAIVGVRDYASHTILVSGLVKDSGTRILRREAIPLYVVVADAQPLPEAAKVTVVRDETNQIFEIDLAQASAMNLLVHPGDVITLQVGETQFIYMGGEVKSPGEKTFHRGLTLTQAIITAGGIGPKSKFAEIGRDDGRGFLVATRFNLVDIASGKIADPLLKPGDRVVILPK